MYSKPKIWLRRQVVLLGIGVMLFLHPTAVDAQTITHQQTKVSLEKLFKIIKTQTGYNVVWSDSKLDVSRTIKADFENASLSTVMNKALAGLGASYLIQNKTIIIKVDKKSAPLKSERPSKLIDVKGTVTDSQGSPIIGATVSDNQGSKRTKTDESGEFLLRGISDNSSVIVSYLGYQSLEVAAAHEFGIQTLLPQPSRLEEVEINAGYYTVKDSERTGSISQITAKDIEKQPVTNVLGAMIGRMAGVNIEQQSGVNGGGFSVEIRGRNSLRQTAGDNGNQPLYLVDNIPFPAASLNPQIALSITGITDQSSPLNILSPSDIESIEILKDADATAIYGSRGANGVVLIRTKKAKSGKTNLDVNVYSGISKVSTKLEMMDLNQFKAMRAEAFFNDNAVPQFYDYDQNGVWEEGRYTDWQGELVGGTAHNSNVSVSLSGGNSSTSYSVRGNYSRNGTVFPGSYHESKGSGAITLTHLSSDQKFKMNFSTSYNTDNNDLPQGNLYSLITTPPNAPGIYDANGNLNWPVDEYGYSTWVNPFSVLQTNFHASSQNLITSGMLSYQLFPGLSVSANLGFTNIHVNSRTLFPITAQDPKYFPTGLHDEGINELKTWIIEPQVNYVKTIGKGIFDVLIGTTFQKNDQERQNIIAVGYTDDLLLDNINAAPIRNGFRYGSQYKYNAVFGRVNFNYDGRYLVNLTGRRDGSSRFGPDRQFANFGAVGAAWIFTKEGFLNDFLPSFLTFGKFRTSYGITGSDQIGDYGFLSTYEASAAYQGATSLIPTRIANREYSWETNKKVDVALEIGLLEQKVTFSVGWYRNRSSNQLVGYSVPDLTGFSSIQSNLPATVQNTGWEFEWNSENIRTKFFNWSTSVNLTLPDNILLAFPNIESSSYANTYRVGESTYQYLPYRFAGIDPVTGLYKIDDLDGNGIYNTADRSPLGKPLTSRVFGGMSNRITYKNLSLDVFLQFARKNSLNSHSPFAAPGTRSTNQLVDVLDRWAEPGSDAKFQKFTQDYTPGGGVEAYANYLAATYSDASFLRLKNISISYSLPTPWLRGTKIGSARFYLHGQNLLTFTKYPGDPETTLIAMPLPVMKTITAGLQINL